MSLGLAAVLTGRLTGAADGSDAAETAMISLAAAAGAIADWTGEETRFTRFRGDGWQIYLDDPSLSLDATLYLRSQIIAARSGLGLRIGVGYGRVERMGPRDLSDAAGSAFVRSGQALDRMARSRVLALAGPDIVRPWHWALFDLTLWHADRWSAEQAEAVAMALDSLHGPRPLRQEDMADRLGVTRQAVQARLRSAGWPALQTVLGAMHGHDWSGTA